MDISSVSGFCGVKGRLNGCCKDVYFIRLLGVNSSLSADIKKMDESMTKAVQNRGIAFYNRISELPKLLSAEDAEYYLRCVKEWEGSGRSVLKTKCSCGNTLNTQLSSAMAETLDIFCKIRAGASASMVENFAVKLLYRFDCIMTDSADYSGKETVKICAENISKPQDYLFFYMLSSVGFDVLLLQNECDIDETLDKLGFSKKTVLGSFGHLNVAPYDSVHAEPASGNIKMTIPENPRRAVSGQVVGFSSNASVSNSSAVRNAVGTQNSAAVQHEKTMEELAELASSVVLITIHNQKGEPIGTGSGIMLSEKGYILTNNHVAGGGYSYSVRIEDDDKIYTTNEIIKYNQVIDLAVIRIDRQLKPIPVYQGGKKLARGQKVVAIGSPLGLFNTVSDGIISGFRVINDVDMIQFTAPISHGSSGGAILNMSGEVIGISTAGIDAGQNLNLAVGYEYINTFTMGLR